MSMLSDANLKLPILVSLHMLAISLATTVLAIPLHYGGVCKDSLGVYSLGAIWGEVCFVLIV